MEVDATPLSADEIGELARRIDRPIVLVGMMGVGKSSLGKRLAALLDCPFIDADDAIEQAARMSIPEIFERFGEGEFRDGERRVLARLMHEGAGLCVIATGGGAFSNEETRKLILEQGVAVWLDADVDTLVERVGRKNNRPLLREGNPREILARLLDERRPAYAQAQVHVKSGDGPHGRTIAGILRGIEAWL